MSLKKIYIGLNYDNYPVGVILADSKALAEVYFEASNSGHHSIEEIDIETIDHTLPGRKYFKLISTDTKSGSDLREVRHDRQVVVMNKR